MERGIFMLICRDIVYYCSPARHAAPRALPPKDFDIQECFSPKYL